MSDLEKGSRRQQGQVYNHPGINQASFNYGIICLLSFHNLKSKSDEKARTLNVDQRGVDTTDRTDLSGSLRGSSTEGLRRMQHCFKRAGFGPRMQLLNWRDLGNE